MFVQVHHLRPPQPSARLLRVHLARLCELCHVIGKFLRLLVAEVGTPCEAGKRWSCPHCVALLRLYTSLTKRRYTAAGSVRTWNLAPLCSLVKPAAGHLAGAVSRIAVVGMATYVVVHAAELWFLF